MTLLNYRKELYGGVCNSCIHHHPAFVALVHLCALKLSSSSPVASQSLLVWKDSDYHVSWCFFVPLLQVQVLTEISIDCCLSPTSVLLFYTLEVSYVQILKEKKSCTCSKGDKWINGGLVFTSPSKLLPQQDLLTTRAILSTVLVAELTWKSAVVLRVLEHFKIKVKYQH